MNRWLLSMCSLLLAPGLAPADEAPPASDPAAAGFERALEARVDEVLGGRVDLAAERAMALLEAREAERLREVAHAPARQTVPEREGVERVRLAETRLLPLLACVAPGAGADRRPRLAALCLGARGLARVVPEREVPPPRAADLDLVRVGARPLPGNGAR
jgi:hypothetical protein